MSNKTLTIKNFHLGTVSRPTVIFKILSGVAPFSQSQAKMRFFRLLKAKLDDLEISRLELCKELCDKDKKGSPIMENNNFKFSPKNQGEFTRKFNELYGQECVIDILASMEGDLGVIKGLINNSKLEVTLAETEELEEIMAAITKAMEKPEKTVNKPTPSKIAKKGKK